RTISLSLLSILASLGFVILSSQAMAQQVDGRYTIQSFPVGTWPTALAFDGANVWVTNLGDNTVTKLRASDGVNLGTFRVGEYPAWITFDGTNVWVSNLNTDNVTKLRASDGTVLGTFGVASGP